MREILFCLMTIFLACATAVPQTATIILHPESPLQIITGWEATAQAGQTDYLELLAKVRDQLFDLTVNDLGINRLRLEVKNGAENPIDWYSRYKDGLITYQEWRQRRYEVINDNDDPFTIDPAGFHFNLMDVTVKEAVLPIKRLLEARGEKLYLNLNYVDFGNSTFEHKNNPEEYAEMILATVLHLRDQYGLTPDAIEVVLEADNAGWSGIQLGEAIVATGNRLKALGVLPAFIAPSTASLSSGIKLFDQMIQIPGVTSYLSEFSYHRYGAVTEEGLRGVENRALRYGIDTSHLERIGATYENLHQDLTQGRNSAWAQYTIAWPASDGTDDGGKYYLIDDRDSNNPTVKQGQRTGYLRQYFKYVRRHAVRIQATSSSPVHQPLAFINADCKPVVVVQAAQGGSFSIQGLAAGTYGIQYTTASQDGINQGDIVVGAGQLLQTSIPAAGVITIHAKSVSCMGLTVVSAASYRGPVLAPGSIVSAFGKDLAGNVLSSSPPSFPTNLSGVTVKIKDSTGVERLGPLFFVSPEQINFQIPPGTSRGQATVSVENGGQITALAGIMITPVAPGLFTANAIGDGAAAAYLLRIRADNSYSYEPAVRFDAAQGKFVPLPIDLGPSTNRVFLVLYGTGISGVSSPAALDARIGGIRAPVMHALPLTEFVGLDQVTLELPRELAGRGLVDVQLTVDGRTANRVMVEIQ